MKEKGFASPLILVVVVLGVAVVGALAYFKLKPESSTQPSNTTQTSKTSQSQMPDAVPGDWKTIKGQISKWQVGGTYEFEFNAPMIFNITKPYPHLTDEHSKYYFDAEGSNIKFFAGLMEGPGPLSVLYGRADKVDLCSKPLILQGTSAGIFEACDILKVDGRELLWLLDVHMTGGDGGVCQQDAKVYVAYNFGDGASFYFSPELDVLKEIIEPWPKVTSGDFCPENFDSSEVKKNMAAKITNIRNANGLSEKDNKTLQTLYQIIPTFKFLD